MSCNWLHFVYKTNEASEVVNEWVLYDEAYHDYKNGMTYKKIAEKYGVKVSTVKSWKSRHWVALDEGAIEKGKKKQGGQFKNKNAKGHGPPLRNQNAVKHGLFAKYLPQETVAIIEDIHGISTLDILWANIEIKFAAILRAQRLMYVKDIDDHLHVSETKIIASTDPGSGQKRVVSKREIVFTAMEREEKFLYAQSRAMDTLLRMIREYEFMINNGALATEEQRARIEKLKLEVETMRSVKGDIAKKIAPVITVSIPSSEEGK